ncbi:MAG: DUF5050 domain-containing protein [Clostridia bacterium]|nr:DUF5050 domain-containing protein [Clostridia bacterium]
MKNRKKIEVCILGIIMITAILIMIINPNKIQKVAEEKPNNQEDNKVTYEEVIDQETLNKQEEIDYSTHIGGTICKIDNQIIFYEKENKTIYYNINNLSTPIITLQENIEQIYFDGQYIYTFPNYHEAKGIYKIDLQGNIQKIYEDYVSQIYLTENKIYFVEQIGFDEFNKNPQGTICVMDKNGENVVELAKEVKNHFFINNGKIYYTTQDRKLCVMNENGEDNETLVQGRKFVIGVSDKYLLYVDYADKEAKHILNLETKEDAVIGYGGTNGEYQGKNYLMCQRLQDDGALEPQFTIFEVKNDGTIKEISEVSDIEAKLKYVKDDKIYLDDEEYADYYFLGGFRYKIDSSILEKIEI